MEEDGKDVIFTTRNCQGFLHFSGEQFLGAGVVPKMDAMKWGNYFFWENFITDFASIGLMEKFNNLGCYTLVDRLNGEGFLVMKSSSNKVDTPSLPSFYKFNDFPLLPYEDVFASLAIDKTFNGNTFVSFHPYYEKFLDHHGSVSPYDNIMVELEETIIDDPAQNMNEVEQVGDIQKGSGRSLRILPLKSLDEKLLTHYIVLQQEIVARVKGL